MKTWLRQKWLSLIFILVLGFAFLLRLYKIDTPVADWHSWRQSDTASVTREYVKQGVDFLHPQYQDISDIPSGEFNPQGWRMVEFPLVNGVLASMVRSQPTWDVVVVSRVASALATLVAIASFGWLIWRLHDPITGVVTAVVWTLLPYAIYYGRAILPEPFLLAMVGVALVSWYAWLTRQKGGSLWLLATVVTGAIALLIKPMAVFYAPAFVGLLCQRNERWLVKGKIRWSVVAVIAGAVVMAVLPLIGWRRWIQHFPAGIPASDWLLNGNGIRLKPAWWRWLFADRIGRLMFGYWGAPVLLFGLVGSLPAWPKGRFRSWKAKLQAGGQFIWSGLERNGTLWGAAGGMFAYLVIFATGNVQHDYYQIVIVPVMCWLWAMGALSLIRWAPTLPQRLGMIVGVTVIGAFSALFAWYFVKDLYNINNWAIVHAGQAVDRLTPPDALVIAPYMGDTAFLFQTNRRGWPIGYSIDQKIEQGADFYVSTTKDDEVGELRARFPVVEETEEYVIFDLRSEG